MLTLTATLLFAGLAQAAWTDDWASVRQGSEQVRSLKTRFRQTKRLPILKNPIVSTGRLYFERPGLLRWEYETPTKSLLVVGKQGPQRASWRDGAWQPDLGAKLEVLQQVLSELGLWMSGRFQESKTFDATLLKQPQPMVRLVPRSGALKGYIERVDVVFGSAPGSVSRIELVEGGGASTTLEFFESALNVPLDPKLFGTGG